MMGLSNKPHAPPLPPSLPLGVPHGLPHALPHTSPPALPPALPLVTLAQLLHSDTAVKHHINNQPPAAHLPNLQRLAIALQTIQTLLQQPLTITSAYRNPAVNQLVGGVPASKHALGLAADFVCPAFGTPLEAARAIAASGIVFDQLIHEYGRWVHFGLAPDGTPPRTQLLTIRNREEGYLDGLLPD